MGFLAPSILLGLLAAGLPWLVHLIGKRRATPVRFAAMQLLLRPSGGWRPAGGCARSCC